jgi:hypothetical protein
MIPKRLDDIDEETLASLLSNAVSEGRTIEYKRQLPSNSDGDKKEFLADVSSFANSGGGDLLFGVEEDDGVPIKIVGIQPTDFDLEIRRLDSIIASGLAPRIRYATRVVKCHNGRASLIVRVDRNWIGPHRVIFKGHDKFYGRNSAGKYPLDVDELRAAFTLPATVTERIRAFRTDRIIAISSGDTPVPLPETPKIVLHCIPIESFSGQPSYDLLSFYSDPTKLGPMAARGGWNRRLNLEGLVVFAGADPSLVYTQLFRNGVIEAVNAHYLAPRYKEDLAIPSIAYEEVVNDYLPICFETLKKMGANAPVLVALTFTSTRGLYMGVDDFGLVQGYPIQADTIVVPAGMVSDFSTPPGKILKPMFDLVWNACGLPASRNFDSEGNWIRRQ